MTECLSHQLFEYMLLEHSLRMNGVHYKTVPTRTPSEVIKFHKGLAGAWSQGGVVLGSCGEGGSQHTDHSSARIASPFVLCR